MSHQLPELQYDYSALEPHIDAKTMEIHHTKHHQAYITNLIKAEEAAQAAIAKGDASALVAATGAINFNGGGHANHSLFWATMSPDGGGEPEGDLAAAINDSFGSFAGMREHFTTKTATIQGSGWGWLCYHPVTKSVVYQATSNQDNPAILGLKPLLGLDVWEHAYYLNYQNRRPDYVGAWWNVVNWEQVGKNLQQARG